MINKTKITSLGYKLTTIIFQLVVLLLLNIYFYIIATKMKIYCE